MGSILWFWGVPAYRDEAQETYPGGSDGQTREGLSGLRSAPPPSSGRTRAVKAGRSHQQAACSLPAHCQGRQHLSFR